MDKKTKESIKELASQKKYNDIYDQYGRDIYLKYVPRKIKNEEIKQLKKEGRFEDIFNKYGEKAAKKVAIKAQYEDRKNEKGILNAVLWRIKAQTLKNVASIGTGAILGITAGVTPIQLMNNKDRIEKNRITYAHEIEDYNKKINTYAEEVKQMRLTDEEIIMKVMKDMWGNIQGYGAPKKDITGFLELDLADKNGVGMCRNMASDVAKKLNAINSKYNARTMIVNLSEDGEYQIANIETKILKNEQNEQSEEKHGAQLPEGVLNTLENVFGNHMITLIDIPEDKLILALDPTNPGIGIYKNGEIKMFNSPEKNGIEFYPRYYSSSVLASTGPEGIKEVIEDFTKSFQKSNLTEEEIEEKYGLNAQNEALNKIEEKKSKRSEFVKSIEVSIDGKPIMNIEDNNKEKTDEKHKEITR